MRFTATKGKQPGSFTLIRTLTLVCFCFCSHPGFAFSWKLAGEVGVFTTNRFVNGSKAIPGFAWTVSGLRSRQNLSFGCSLSFHSLDLEFSDPDPTIGTRTRYNYGAPLYSASLVLNRNFPLPAGNIYLGGGLGWAFASVRQPLGRQSWSSAAGPAFRLQAGIEKNLGRRFFLGFGIAPRLYFLSYKGEESGRTLSRRLNVLTFPVSGSVGIKF